MNAQRFERCGVGKCFVGKWKNSTPTPIGPMVLKQTGSNPVFLKQRVGSKVWVLLIFDPRVGAKDFPKPKWEMLMII